MVHPVEEGEEPPAFVLDGHAGVQQSRSRTVSVTRRSYTIKEKRELVQAIHTLASNGVSIRRACPLLGLPHQYYYRFKKAVEVADELEENDVFIHYKVNGTARKIHPGRPSILAPVRDGLMQFVAVTRMRGIQVSSRMVRHEASRLLPNFMTKSINAREKAVLRFTKQMGLSHRAATHTAQKDYHETMEESRHFIEMMRDKVADKDPALIINMDQTPIPFSFHAAKTLEKKGMKTIHVRSSTSDTKRVTLAATVDASGRMLPPMLIFKGAANGRIAREFAAYPDEGHYACQKKAWMDEEMMSKWIDVVLIPWRNEKGPDVIPILILDAYRVHMMGNIVNRIQSLGIEVVHIPPGCTYLCQPVDVGINKSIKSGMREKWENWMVAGDGIVNGVAKEPTRQLVAEWAVEVYKNLPAQTVRNAWMKSGFEWF